MKELIFAGFGGQGVLTIGLILSEIAIEKGLNATWMPSYGSAMRGGTANCTVKFGTERIYNPSQEEADLLLAMNLPSFHKFQKLLKPGGIIVVNRDTVSIENFQRSDVRIVEVPCSTLAKELGNERGANIIMAGVILRLLEEFPLEGALVSMNELFRKKGKESYEKKNTEALKAGYAFGLEG